MSANLIGGSKFSKRGLSLCLQALRVDISTPYRPKRPFWKLLLPKNEKLWRKMGFIPSRSEKGIF
jgi:hypothetical protein